MTQRSKWCDVDKETRKYVLKRDKHCIFCGAKKPLTMVHVFLSRAKGGKGCKENILAGCTQCHFFILDNPIGKKNNQKSVEMMTKAKNHLIKEENITVNKEFMDSLRYKKVLGGPEPIKAYNPPITNESKWVNQCFDKCQDCRYLKKNKFNNSSIPSYFCVAKKQVVGKKNKACDKFKKKEEPGC